MASENKGIINSVGDSIGGTLDRLLDLPDSPEHPYARLAARVGACALIMLLGVVVFCAMTQTLPWNIGGSLSMLANPSFMQMMAIPMSGTIVSVGLGWGLQYILGKHQRTAAKIMAVITPSLFVAGTLCLMGAGFYSYVTGASFTTYFFSGLLMLPITCVILHNSKKTLEKEDIYIYNRLPRTSNRRYNRPAGGTSRKGQANRLLPLQPKQPSSGSSSRSRRTRTGNRKRDIAHRKKDRPLSFSTASSTTSHSAGNTDNGTDRSNRKTPKPNSRSSSGIGSSSSSHRSNRGRKRGKNYKINSEESD